MALAKKLLPWPCIAAAEVNFAIGRRPESGAGAMPTTTTTQANPSRTSPDSHHGPNDDRRYGTDPFKTLKDHIESNKILLIPVAASFSRKAASCSRKPGKPHHSGLTST